MPQGTENRIVTRDQFMQSLVQDQPGPAWSLAMQSLWYAAKDKWDAAHECAQADASAMGSWIHAYLHRVEGDAGNAAYWYRRAGQPFPKVELKQEWVNLVESAINLEAP